VSEDQGNEPEDTMPFTHRPYGSDEPENPFTSPSGAASQPSGSGYLPPPSQPPPMSSPPDPAGGWGAAWAPAYGAPMPGADHKGANQAMVLGIVAMVCLGLSFFCCVTIPGLVCAPIAWVKGARAKREIDASPGLYANRGQAVAGLVMGVIGSVCGLLVIAAVIGVAVLVGSGWSLV
jgi:hypothetical protein